MKKSISFTKEAPIMGSCTQVLQCKNWISRLPSVTIDSFRDHGLGRKDVDLTYLEDMIGIASWFS